MSRGNWLPALAACCALASAVRSARADGLDGERFAPAVGTEASFSFEHPTVPFHLGWGLGLFFGAADDPVVERQDGEVLSRPLDTAASIDLLGSVGLFGWAELGVALPLRVVYEGDEIAQGGAMLAADTGVGDLRLVPKALLVRTGDAARHFLFGVAVPVTLPTGDDEALRGAGGVTVEPRLTAALYGERLGLGGSIGYRWRSQHPVGLPYADEITLAAMASYAIVPDALSFQAELSGGKQVGADVEGADFPLEALAGLIYRVGDSWDLHGGVGLGMTDGIGDPDLRGVVGLRFRHRVPERHGFLDTDQDGILDKDDDCPTDVEDLDAFQDDDGCPELDNDEDGVPDETDECPDIPEEPGGDRDGCPSKTYVKIVDGTIQVFGKVLFRLGSADIETRSDPLLDQLAAALRASPEVKRVRIEGHTDNVGDPAFNQQLSEKRAARVASELEKRGIDDDRLETVGHGETRPAAPNGSPAGRAKNRRVEFIIVE
ncbi:MAG TPA: OmpA family protein [Kofleriaceae bacterium]|nr:OmpA family protein [Kofleriaceae bacterium]